MYLNIGRCDRIGRIVLGAGLLALFAARPRSWWALVGVLPLISAFRGNCPIYSVTGTSTRRDGPRNGNALGLHDDGAFRSSISVMG